MQKHCIAAMFFIMKALSLRHKPLRLFVPLLFLQASKPLFKSSKKQFLDNYLRHSNHQITCLPIALKIPMHSTQRTVNLRSF